MVSTVKTPYVVQSGDTLTKIAQKNHVSIEQLKSCNPHLFGEVKDGGNKLYVGENVFIPAEHEYCDSTDFGQLFYAPSAHINAQQFAKNTRAPFSLEAPSTNHYTTAPIKDQDSAPINNTQLKTIVVGSPVAVEMHECTRGLETLRFHQAVGTVVGIDLVSGNLQIHFDQNTPTEVEIVYRNSYKEGLGKIPEECAYTALPAANVTGITLPERVSSLVDEEALASVVYEEQYSSN